MKNLENYGVLEMDTKEMKEVDGGFLKTLLWAFVGWLLAKIL